MSAIINIIDTTKPEITDAEINKSIIIKKGAGLPLNQVEIDYLNRMKEEDREENEKIFGRNNKKT